MNFEDFFDHSEPTISSAAEILAEARDGLENNQLTEEQFDEIVEDTVQIEEMEELADSLERKIAVREGAEALLSIARSFI